jgi:hypothetical protein
LIPNTRHLELKEFVEYLTVEPAVMWLADAADVTGAVELKQAAGLHERTE